jgi:twitching motility protein PilT
MAVSTLNDLLKAMVEQGGSDLHVTTNSAPQIRVDGVLHPLNHPPLTPTQAKQLAYSILTDNQKHRLEENLEIDFSFGIKGMARFRANVFHQRGAIAAAFRQIPYEIRTFRELGLPAVSEKLCEKPRGLVLVTGPTGSGKSTTLAPDIAARACDSVEEALSGADIIVTVTSSNEPVLRRDWLELGTHINLVGSSVSSAREADGATMAAGSLFVDRRESAGSRRGSAGRRRRWRRAGGRRWRGSGPAP